MTPGSRVEPYGALWTRRGAHRNPSEPLWNLMEIRPNAVWDLLTGVSHSIHLVCVYHRQLVTNCVPIVPALPQEKDFRLRLKSNRFHFGFNLTLA